MRLALSLDPSVIEFTEASSRGRHPYLSDVGELHLAARAGEAIGIGATESSSVPVELAEPRKVMAIIGYPLRAHADLYDDDGELFFSGIVSSIDIGTKVTLEIGA